MNGYAIVVLAALLVEFAMRVAGDLLNLRALAPELPPRFAHLYDAERYRRSQEYTRVRTRFGLVPATLHLVALLGFWAAGGFGWLDGALRGLGLPSIPTGLLFIGALVAARGALSLPFRVYSTFVIEERFGFNRTTPATFVADLAKGLVLGVALGAPLVAGILWLFEAAGPHAWLACWALAATFTLVVQLLAPTWIFPLFHRFEPLAPGELRDAITEYARRVDFPLADLYVIDGSRRSSKANAFFTGFGRHKRIALFDTLVDQHPTPELVAVLAHEIGHYKRGHVLRGLAISLVYSGVVFYLLSLVLTREGLFTAFGVTEPSVYAGLVFFGLLFAPIDLALSFVARGLSRRHEYQADAFARDTGHAEALARGLERLSAEQLTNLTPHPFYVALHYTHPPLGQRLAALRADA